jgi:hypothetical protein
MEFWLLIGVAVILYYVIKAVATILKTASSEEK